MSVNTVKVSNVSLGASGQEIREFFSFSGDIEYVELQRENERSQIAFVTFKDSQGAETALLLSGATIVDLAVSIFLAPDYCWNLSVPLQRKLFVGSPDSEEEDGRAPLGDYNRRNKDITSPDSPPIWGFHDASIDESIRIHAPAHCLDF